VVPSPAGGRGLGRGWKKAVGWWKADGGVRVLPYPGTIRTIRSSMR
jgi:hypothetical protein